MAIVTMTPAIDAAHGEFGKNSGVILRQKKYRARNGAVLHQGKQEAYKILHPRDYDKTPPQGAELENIKLFTDSKNIASEIIRSGRYSDEELASMTLAERTHVLNLRDLLEDYTQRFYKQFKRPDPEAPFHKRPRPGSTKLLRKQYVKLDTFIQALERQKLISAPAPTPTETD